MYPRSAVRGICKRSGGFLGACPERTTSSKRLEHRVTPESGGYEGEEGVGTDVVHTYTYKTYGKATSLLVQPLFSDFIHSLLQSTCISTFTSSHDLPVFNPTTNNYPSSFTSRRKNTPTLLDILRNSIGVFLVCPTV